MINLHTIKDFRHLNQHKCLLIEFVNNKFRFKITLDNNGQIYFLMEKMFIKMCLYNMVMLLRKKEYSFNCCLTLKIQN